LKVTKANITYVLVDDSIAFGKNTHIENL